MKIKGLLNEKWGILLSLYLAIIFSFIPGILRPQEKFNSFDNKEMQSELIYGDNIKNDADWQNYSKGVEQKLEGDWETSALNELMQQLGLTEHEAMSNSDFITAKTNWEAQASNVIQQMYGSWLAQNKWNYAVNGSAIRQFIVQYVWEDQNDTSNITANILSMQTNVDAEWSNYLICYQAGLSDYLNYLETNTQNISSTAMENYLDAIQATAKAQMAAASDIGSEFIALEEGQYIKYMASFLAYQQFISNNSLITNGLQLSNNMVSYISNAADAASNVNSPLTIAENVIQSMDSNEAEIAGLLAMPTNFTDSPAVGISEWKSMVEQDYTAGISEWDAAIANLSNSMIIWENNAENGYTNGLTEWENSYFMLISAEMDFQSNVTADLTNSEAVWGSNISAQYDSLNLMIGTMTNLTARNIDNFNSYESGLMNVLVNGSYALNELNKSLDWISNTLSVDEISNNYYSNLYASDMAKSNLDESELSSSNTLLSLFNNCQSILEPLMVLTGTNRYFQGGEGGVEAVPAYSASTNIDGYTLTYSGDSYNNSYTVNGNEIYYTANGFSFENSEPVMIIKSYINSIQSDLNSIQNAIQTNKWYYRHYSSEIGSLNNVLGECGTNLGAVIGNAAADLNSELYSGDPGAGVLANALSNTADIYLMNSAEMDYASQQDQVNYLKQNLGIAQAVMDYAVSNSGGGDILSASNTYEAAVSNYDVSTNELEAEQAAADSADVAMTNYMENINAAQTNMIADQSNCGIAQSNYNAFVTIQTNLDYFTSKEYSNLINSNENAQNILSNDSIAYYSCLAYYTGLVKDYYNALEQESFTNSLAMSNYITVREDLGILEWALMPGMLGIDNTSNAYVSVANYINPVSDYSNALQLYDTAENGLARTSNLIIAEETLPANMQSEVNNFIGDYSDYSKLMNFAQSFMNQEQTVYQSLEGAKSTYDRDATNSFGLSADDIASDPVYADVVKKMSAGAYTPADIITMLNNEIGVTGANSDISQDELNITRTTILDDFYKYVNTPEESLYELAFGIRSYDYFTNIAGANLTAFDNLVHTTFLSGRVDNSLLNPGAYVDVQGYIDGLTALLSTPGLDPNMSNVINNLANVLAPEGSYFQLSRGYIPAITNVNITPANTNWPQEAPQPIITPAVTNITISRLGGYYADDTFYNVNTNNGREKISDLFKGFIETNNSVTYSWATVNPNNYFDYNGYYGNWSYYNSVLLGIEKNEETTIVMPLMSTMTNNLAGVMSDWNDYSNKNAGFAQYTVSGMGHFVNSSGGIDVTAGNNGFLKSFKNSLSRVSNFSIAQSWLANTGVFNAEEAYIADNLSLGNAGTNDIGRILEVFENAFKLYINSEQSNIQNDPAFTTNNDMKLFITTMLSGAYSNAVFRASDEAQPSFVDAAENAGSLAPEAFDIAFQQQETLQVDKWAYILTNMQDQANSEAEMWVNIYSAGTEQWNGVINQYTNAMSDWQSSYLQAWNNGNQEWNDQMNGLTGDKAAWMNEAINAVSNGSSDYILDQLMQSIDQRTSQFLSGGLPEDVASAVKNEALDLENELMPKTSEEYLSFFNNAVSQSRETDVKFVLDGIAGYTGNDNETLAQFNNDMTAFKNSQLAIEAIKMRDQFVTTIQQYVDQMNNTLASDDQNERSSEFYPMISAKGWTLDGSDWVKRGVIVHSTMLGGNQLEDFSFADYQSFTNRLNFINYAPSNVISEINGEQTEYNLLLAMEESDIQGDMSNTMDAFDKHIGSSYTYTSKPDIYSDGTYDSQGELYRTSWATTYYGYLQTEGLSESEKPFWDQNLAPGIDISFYSLNEIGLAIALNFIPGMGTVASAAILAGMAMTHDIVDAAAELGTVNQVSNSQLGIDLLKDTISGVTTMATAGIGSAALGVVGSAVLSTGVQDLSGLAEEGLHVNSSGDIDWSMTSSQWGSWGMSSLGDLAGSVAGAGLGSAFGGFAQDATGFMGDDLSSAFGNGIQNFTTSFFTNTFSTLGSNLGAGLDWNNMTLNPSTWNMKAGSTINMNWGNILNNSLVAGASGFASGLAGSLLGGQYNADMGGMDYNGLIGGDAYNNFANVIGSFAGQGANYELNGSFNIDLGAGIGTSYVNGKGFVRNDGTSGVSLISCLQGFSDLSNSSNLPALPVNNNQDASTTPELPQAILPKDPSDYIPESDIVNPNVPDNSYSGANNAANPNPNAFTPATVAYNEIGQQVPLTDTQSPVVPQTVNPYDHISDGNNSGPILPYQQVAEQAYLNQSDAYKTQISDLQNNLGIVTSAGIINTSSAVSDLKSDIHVTDNAMQQNYSSYLGNAGIDVSRFTKDANGNITSNISNNSSFVSQVYQDQVDHYNRVMDDAKDNAVVNGINNTYNAMLSANNNANIVQNVGLGNAGNITDVINYQNDIRSNNILNMNGSNNGNIVSDSLQNKGNYFMVGEQGLGFGTPAGNYGDSYSDRISVFKMDDAGNIDLKEFNQSNLESTNDKYDSKTNTYDPTQQQYSDTASGIYNLTTYQWTGEGHDSPGMQFCFLINDKGPVSTSDGMNNVAYPWQGPIIYDSRVHTGGVYWNGSEACSTINPNDYYQLMSMFQNSNGSYQYGSQGTYYLLR